MAPSERLLKDREQPRFNMVNSQLRPNGVNEPRLIKAFSTTPMEAFVPPMIQSLVYADTDLPLTTELHQKRWLLSPLTLAKLLQLAKIQPGDNVLIIGCGTGYSIALVSQLAAQVVGVECDDNLASLARTYAAEQEIFNIQVVTGALSLGYSKEAPYDVILIEGAVDKIPTVLMKQLSPNQGRLVTVLKEKSDQDHFNFGQGILMTRSEDQIVDVSSFDASCPHLPEFEPREGFVL